MRPDQRGAGRPPIGPVVKARVSPELLDQVNQFAQLHGLKQAEAVRRLITAGLATSDQ